jgi:hypothetical protein
MIETQTDHDGVRQPSSDPADTSSPSSELTEADAHGCRWISGEPSPIRSGMWCCEPTVVPSDPYCARHRAIAWNYKRGRRVRPGQVSYALPT